MSEITVLSKPQPDMEDEAYQEAMLNIVAGIQRWLEREENNGWKEAFTRNQSWQFYQQGLDDVLYDAMDADPWLSRWQYSPFNEIALWDDAVYQVTTLLCQKESE